MKPGTVFYIIVGILIFHFLFDLILELLNKSKWKEELPDELKGIYDEEKYRKHIKYKKANFSFGIISETVNLIIILIVLFNDGFAVLNNWVISTTASPVLQALLFFGVIGLASTIISLPFSIYSTFVIEEKFGFNKTTPKTFILDLIKSLLLGAVIGGGLLALIVWFYTLAGDNFWIYAWILTSAFMIFMSMFYTSLILPLFNKQTPLEEGELRNAIEEYSNKTGFNLDNIYVMDGSKRSTKANAFFSGLGKKKRIVLYDTLIKDLTTEQIIAVLAHETGHYKLKHTLWGIVTGIIQTGIMFWLFSLFVSSPVLSKALGVDEPNFHIGLLVFGMLYTPISFVLDTVMGFISRKNEFAADAYAAKTSNAKALEEALKNISVKSLSNLTPHPLYVFFHYSHPPLLDRLKSLYK
ncbi:MAG: M48 family metallopeptidase [Chlorobi bacterium]|nr:M48 family metallopeptidase [Chlorobiota bacterium]